MNKRKLLESGPTRAEARALRAGAPLKAKRVFNLAWLYVPGGILALLGVIALAVLCASGWSGHELTGVFPFIPQTEGADISTPGVLFAIAMVPLFVAELLRRARWSEQDRSFLRGGSVKTVMTPTRTSIALAWMLVPILAWIALVPVPIALYLSAPEGAQTPSEEFWVVAQFYGALAALIVGVMVISLVKRASYASRRGKEQAPMSGRTFWTVLAVQWRAESFLGAIGFGIASYIPFLAQDAAMKGLPYDETAFMVLVILSALFTTLAVIVATNAWRSGEPFGAAESVA